jgi:hypothetical protein
MSSGLKRRRLVKKHPEDPDVYRIPKKASGHTGVPDHSRRAPSDSENEGFDDFITDKVEFLSDHLPSSSEESAHSTDEEGSRRRHREERPKREEESAHETDSAPEETPEPSDAEASDSGMATAPDPTRNLIGKEALAAKRAQGLLPPKPTDIPKHHHSKKHHKHKHKHREKEVKKHHSEHKKPEKESKKYVQFGEFETAEERSKADLVTKVLVRWWYVLPDWPPAADYAPLLAAKNLRLVDSGAWLQEPQFDQGREKVREVPGYAGVFQNSKGLLFDLRDQSTCPSFSNLFAKPVSELRRLLATALEKQLEELKAQPDCDPKLAKQLSKELQFVAGA